MAWRTSFELAGICIAIGTLFPSTVLAQTIVVDATPSHAVNSFSPIRGLGAGADWVRARIGCGRGQVAGG
jgi:hypothetical protein